jgi:hypothetical protein
MHVCACEGVGTAQARVAVAVVQASASRVHSNAHKVEDNTTWVEGTHFSEPTIGARSVSVAFGTTGAVATALRSWLGVAKGEHECVSVCV